MTGTADGLLAALFRGQARADPYPHYQALRRLGPVARLDSTLPGASPFEAVATGYDAVDRLLRDPDWYKKARPDWREHPLLTTFESSMMFSNPPMHTRMRQLFHRVFTPRRLAAIEPAIVRTVTERLDRLAELGAGGAPVDFVAEFGFPVPARVMAEFIGIPASELDWYRGRVELIDAYLDLGGKRPEVLAAANGATDELRGFYRELLASRRADPRDDLISACLASIAAGEHELTEDELISNLIVLFNASFVTTIHLLGNALRLLLERPELAARLPADEAYALRCVDEVLRLESPVQFLARAASYDTELEGVPVPAHGQVLLLIGAANRDPDRYPEPEEFQPDRARRPNLAFGAGAHYCLGAAVARAEGRIALPRLFARFGKLAAAGPALPVESLFFRGVRALPVTVE